MSDTQKGFVFGTPDSSSKVHVVKRIASLEPYLTEYVDGEGRTLVSIVFRMKNADSCFILNQKAGGTNIATEAYPWFTREFNKALNRGKESGEAESV